MSSNTKSGETPIPSQENIPQLCKGNCGFFGSQETRGWCSVCFKKEVKEESQDVKKDETPVASRDMSDSPTAPMTDAMADLMKPEVQVPEVKAEVEEKSPESPKIPKRESPIAQEDEKSPVTTPAKKQKKKCGVCKKKLGLTGFECRCGFFYCGIHRYSDKHNCTFDYKTVGREQIAAANQACVGEKVQKL